MAGETIQRLAVFLDELNSSGASVMEIARALKVLDLRVHRSLQREALEQEDPGIIEYLRTEAPVFYQGYEFTRQAREWLAVK